MRLRFAAAILALCVGSALPQASDAVTLQPLDLGMDRLVVNNNGVGGAQTIFSTYMKRDKNVQNSGQSGPDVFLYDQSGSSNRPINVDWAASGTTYNWGVSYDGSVATLTFGNTTRSMSVGQNMLWNAVKIYLGASDKRFATATTAVTIDTVNGAVPTNPLHLSVTNSTSTSAYALIRFDQMASLSGTLRYSFQAMAGAKGSPEGGLSFIMEAIQLAPTGVPVPAALPLLMAGLGALGVVRRRRRG